TQVGCMGYCYAEPTVEVTIPGAEPVVFGYVDTRRADEIIERYIKNGERVGDVIPVTYLTINEQ
ncbi:MAG: (2Fe-2S) ferredoxin domain-containing protein, partial [Bacteroidales bacterium]